MDWRCGSSIVNLPCKLKTLNSNPSPTPPAKNSIMKHTKHCKRKRSKEGMGIKCKE
jgi:hypothetical protein